jgi:hypothetical protein
LLNIQANATGRVLRRLNQGTDPMPYPIANRFVRIAAFAALLAFAGAAHANESFATTGGDPFTGTEKVAFAGFSVGYFGTSGNFLIPPMQAGVDIGFHQYMTAGGMFGYSRYDYLKESLQYISFAARGTFHPIFWFTKVPVPLDPYFLATAGYTQAVWSGPGSYNYSYIVLGPAVGARYWFKPNLAGQAESGFGNGVSLASISLALKF